MVEANSDNLPLAMQPLDVTFSLLVKYTEVYKKIFEVRIKMTVKAKNFPTVIL